MTPETKAIEAARECALAIPPDVLEHPMPFPARLDYAAKRISKSLSLPQLFAIVEAANPKGALGIQESNLRAVAWHLAEGQDNGGISRQGLADALRSCADTLLAVHEALAAYHTAQKREP